MTPGLSLEKIASDLSEGVNQDIRGLGRPA